MVEIFVLTDEEKQILQVAKSIVAKIMNQCNSSDTGDEPGPIFTESSLTVTGLHTLMYYIEQDEPVTLRNEPALARLKRYMESLDTKIEGEEFGLARTAMMQLNNDLYDLFPELHPVQRWELFDPQAGDSPPDQTDQEGTE